METRSAMKQICKAAGACYRARTNPKTFLKALAGLPEGLELQDAIRGGKKAGLGEDQIRPLLKAEFGGGETGVNLYNEAQPMMAVETDPELADGTGEEEGKA